MMESTPQTTTEKISPSIEKRNSLERPPHLDVTNLMREKNCYFVHTIQVTKALDVSENNRSIDTKALSPADRLDILYAANPTISASSLRPGTLDGTFYGGFGVLLTQGEIVSASQGDDGTIAQSLTERAIIGRLKNTAEDIDRAIDRKIDGVGKSYNEIVLKTPEVAGGFMKIDKDNYTKRISYKESTEDYGSGGGVVTKKYGVLNLANVKNVVSFDTPYSVLLEMKKRGPVFLLNGDNEMLQVTDIDEKTREVSFSLTPSTPQDFAEIYGEQKMNKYTKQEMLDRVADKIKPKLN